MLTNQTNDGENGVKIEIIIRINSVTGDKKVNVCYSYPGHSPH